MYVSYGSEKTNLKQLWGCLKNHQLLAPRIFFGIFQISKNVDQKSKIPILKNFDFFLDFFKSENFHKIFLNSKKKTIFFGVEKFFGV